MGMLVKEGMNKASNRRSARIAIQNDVEPEDWRDCYERVDATKPPLAKAMFHAVVGAATLVGLFVSFGAIMLLLSRLLPDISRFSMGCMLLPPAFLAGAGMGQVGGNVFLRLWLRMDPSTRRGFAMRLTLERADGAWPVFVRRWLFTGDWLAAPDFDARLPYVRIFTAGANAKTCSEEAVFWNEVLGRLAGEGAWEAGANHREISYPEKLPAWSRSIADGDGVEGVEKRLGREAAREWIGHLWRRACRQWPHLGTREYPDAARKGVFEAHYLELSQGRTALIVVLRPAHLADEVAAETVVAHSIAA